MHAVVASVRINDEEAAHAYLHEQIVPMVAKLPGFVSGVWLAAQDGEGNSVVVLETEEAAQAMAEMVRAREGGPAEVVSVTVREVAATA